MHIQQQAAARRAYRADRRAEYHAAVADDTRAHDAHGKGRRAPKENQLPGGMLVKLCIARQLLPGPETHEAIRLLKCKVAAGDLKSDQPYEYYLDELDRLGV